MDARDATVEVVGHGTAAGRPVATMVIPTLELQTVCVAGVDRVGSEQSSGGFEHAQRQVLALDPRLAYQLIRSEPPPRVDLEEARHHILGLTGHEFRVFVLSSLDFGVEFALRLTFEGERAHEHGVEQYAERPHVDLPAVVLLLSDELGRHVGWRSTKYFLFLAILTKSCEAKIYYLDHICVVFYQDVVELDVPMRNTFVMQVIKSFSDLLEEAAADALLHLPICTFLLHILVQRYALNIIRDKANLFSSFNYIVHSDYVRVVNFLECEYLTLHGLPFHRIIELDFLINLNCTLLHRLLVVARVDACVGALADGLADLIIIKLPKTDMSRLVERLRWLIWWPVQQGAVLGLLQPILLASTYDLCGI